MDIRYRTAWISAVASFLIFIFKIIAFQLTQSKALMSDALESIVNVFASLIALGVIRYALQPPDKEHPYGHGKAEFFSAAFEGGMVFFAALVIIYESAKSLLESKALLSLQSGMLWAAGAAVLNLILGLYLRHIGRKHNSGTLQASGAHVLSDVWTTAGAIVGLALVAWTGMTWIDGVVALVLGIYLAFTGFSILQDSFSGLIDAAEPDVLQKLVQAFNKSRESGIIDIHYLRAIRSGSFHHMDAHVIVPEFWSVSETHDRVNRFETVVVKNYDFDGEIAFHVDPCDRNYCEKCNLSDCPVRRHPFKAVEPFVLEKIVENPPHS
ncbi:MAG: cation diffusion facilitator family transporter [Pseudobdellovibrionaceae bacterium]